jgi:hypothetical protein
MAIKRGYSEPSQGQLIVLAKLLFQAVAHPNFDRFAPLGNRSFESAPGHRTLPVAVVHNWTDCGLVKWIFNPPSCPSWSPEYTFAKRQRGSYCGLLYTSSKPVTYAVSKTPLKMPSYANSATPAKGTSSKKSETKLVWVYLPLHSSNLLGQQAIEEIFK